MKLSAGLAFTLLAYQQLAEAAGSSASLSARERILKRTEASSSGHASYKGQQASSQGQVRGTARNLAKGDEKKTEKTEKEGGKERTGKEAGDKKEKGEKTKKEKKEKEPKTRTTGNRAGDGGGGKKAKGARGGDPKKLHSAHMDANDSHVDLNAVEYSYGDPISITFKLTNDMVSTKELEMLDVTAKGEWTMGVFMRMADPQDGALQPIVSVTPSLEDAGEEDRRLQDEGTTETGTTVAPPMETDEEDREPVNLNMIGSATITTTDAETLSPKGVGTGFDVFLLDDQGRAIIGPATFYMIPTQAMVDEEEEKKNKKSSHPLAKFDHSAKKKKKGKGRHVTPTSGKGDASGTGYGSGKNGGMILSTAESLADYLLVTDKDSYALGDLVKVTYELGPEVIDEARRNLKNTNSNAGGNGGVFGNDNGNGGGYSNSDSDTTTQATDAPDTTGSTEQPETDQGAPDEEDPNAGMEATMVDPTDVTLFSLGVYMKMANPQEGALPPIVSIPFCDIHDCTAEVVDVDEFQNGEFEFNTEELDIPKNGIGYDVWILNGLGHGIAGPFYFSIE